jgi:excisionase family DNA binding protein
MSQTRTKTRKPKSAKTPTGSNGAFPPTTDVFNFTEAAAYLRVTESELRCLIHDQALPGRQFGTEWRFLKSALQDWLKTPPQRGSREAVLSVAGAWKDDPEMVAETMAIYDKRKEDLVGDM